MRTVLCFLCAAAALLIPLTGCDNYSLLENYDRTGGLSLTSSSASVESDGTIRLYAAGGTEPYTWMLVENELAYIDPLNRLGAISNSEYTAGNSIGSISVRLRDSAGNTENAIITVIPPSPPDLSVSTYFLHNRLTLNWTFTCPDQINGFTIFRSKDGEPFVEVTTTGSGISTYIDTGLSAHTPYTYYLQAVNGAYRSRPTAQIQGTTL